MNVITKFALASLGTLVVIAIGILYPRSAVKATPAHGRVARDLSASNSSDCSCTVGLVKRALGEPNMRKGSTLSLITSGDESTANEPVLIGSYDVPSTRSAIEERKATMRKQEVLLKDVKGRCEKLETTERSPIFLLIKRAVEELRVLGCGSASDDCFVFVQTDGEEKAEASVKQLLYNKRPIKRPADASSIDNRGINVTFFGLSQTMGEKYGAEGRQYQLTRARDAARVDRLRAVWLSFFTQPERVKFEPFCPND